MPVEIQLNMTEEEIPSRFWHISTVFRGIRSPQTAILKSSSLRIWHLLKRKHLNWSFPPLVTTLIENTPQSVLTMKYTERTPRNRVILDRVRFPPLFKKFPAFYGSWKFITVPTPPCYGPLSWARLVQTTSGHVRHFNIILPPTTRSCKWSLSFRFSQPNPTLIHILPMCATYSAHLILLDHPHKIWWGVQIIKLHIMQFSPVSVTSSLLGPNTFLSTLFSKPLSLRCSLYVRDQGSHPYTTNKMHL
jgi:hypothetical protein